MYVHEGIVKDTLINNDIPFKSKSHNEPIPNARSDKYGSKSGDDFLHNVLSFLSIGLGDSEQVLVDSFLHYLNLNDDIHVVNFGDTFTSIMGRNDSTSLEHLNNYFEKQSTNTNYFVFNFQKLENISNTQYYKYCNRVFVFISEHAVNIDVDELCKSINQEESNVHFVICHSDSCAKPNDTLYIFNYKLPQHFSHVQNNENDFARLYRLIKGNSITLVLGGGGCKGLAHLGILKALEEYNIPIDAVCGTSIGAIVAYLWAIHRTSDGAIDRARHFFMDNPTPWWDLNVIPRKSLYGGKKIDAIFKSQIQNHQIEDLWLPFFCNSSNLAKLELMIHDQGSSLTALRASLAIPGIFPPVLHEDKVLVDGGVFNNLPVDIVSNKRKGKIIASRVDLPSSSIVNNKIPNIFSTLYQSSTANVDMNTEKNRGLIDLYFEPRVSKYGMMQWMAIDEIIQTGYEYACQKLSQQEDISILFGKI
jgi:predicted acylesterase/phospholipase RssA